MAVTTGAALISAGGAAYAANKQASAADAQADALQQSGSLSRKQTKKALEEQRQQLRPFRRIGLDAAKQIAPGRSSLIYNVKRQTGFLEKNPIFQAATNQITRNVLANQAARGKLGSGGTLAELQDRFVAAGAPLLQNQQNLLFNLASLGQNAAARVGSGAIQTGANLAGLTSNLGAQLGNVRAAGDIGQANIIGGALGDISQLIAQGGFAGSEPPPPGASGGSIINTRSLGQPRDEFLSLFG